jgi:chaperonin GroEL (HSP60 family)
LVDYAPESEGDLKRILEFAAKLQKPMLLIAPDFKPDALTALVVNHLQNKVRVVAVKTPMGE